MDLQSRYKARIKPAKAVIGLNKTKRSNVVVGRTFQISAGIDEQNETETRFTVSSD